MRRKIYRSLDKPACFFGLRGRYTTWMAMGMGVVFILSFFIGTMTIRFIGYITFALGGIGLYLFIVNYQETVSDRQLDKKLDSRKFTSCITRAPGPLRRLWGH